MYRRVPGSAETYYLDEGHRLPAELWRLSADRTFEREPAEPLIVLRLSAAPMDHANAGLSVDCTAHTYTVRGEGDALSATRVRGASGAISPISKLRRITGATRPVYDAADATLAPPLATHVAFAYPAQEGEDFCLLLEALEARVGAAAFALADGFLAGGGFVYLRSDDPHDPAAALRLCGARAMGRRTKGASNHLEFSGPFPLGGAMRAALEAQPGALQRVTFEVLRNMGVRRFYIIDLVMTQFPVWQVLRNMGVRRFCWLEPGERVDGMDPKYGSLNGGFAYLYGEKQASAHDCYFTLDSGGDAAPEEAYVPVVSRSRSRGSFGSSSDQSETRLGSSRDLAVAAKMSAAVVQPSSASGRTAPPPPESPAVGIVPSG